MVSCIERRERRDVREGDEMRSESRNMRQESRACLEGR